MMQDFYMLFIQKMLGCDDIITILLFYVKALKKHPVRLPTLRFQLRIRLRLRVEPSPESQHQIESISYG
jgi:hypothetical protein